MSIYIRCTYMYLGTGKEFAHNLENNFDFNVKGMWKDLFCVGKVICRSWSGVRLGTRNLYCKYRNLENIASFLQPRYGKYKLCEW